MNIIEKGLLIVIVLAMSFFMLPTLLGMIFTQISELVQFIVIFAFILGIIGFVALTIKHKEE